MGLTQSILNYTYDIWIRWFNKQPKRIKKNKIPSYIRNQVWITYHNNSDTGICYCCGKKIQRYNKGWHASHVLSYNKGGLNTVENLRPCCPHCNLSMGNCNLYTYIKMKGLTGPGFKNVDKYLTVNPSQSIDKRTHRNKVL